MVQSQSCSLMAFESDGSIKELLGVRIQTLLDMYADDSTLGAASWTLDVIE